MHHSWCLYIGICGSVFLPLIRLHVRMHACMPTLDQESLTAGLWGPLIGPEPSFGRDGMMLADRMRALHSRRRAKYVFCSGFADCIMSSSLSRRHQVRANTLKVTLDADHQQAERVCVFE